MIGNPLQQLGVLGQSIWIDYIRRNLISSGGLRRLIVQDGLRGMTSNPAIFGHALSTGEEYNADILAMDIEGISVEAIYEALSQQDVRAAADEFGPLFQRSDGRDGFVSLEVNPHLAHDTSRTIVEARRLWAALNRPNVMIKVPATSSGIVAIEQLISEGININVTLLFGLPRYRLAAEAYIAGIERRAAQGKSIEHVASVASFFVSRIDTLVDSQLEKLALSGTKQGDWAVKLRGKTAVASAKLAYQIHKEIFGGERFGNLAAIGANVQRLLWASTGTKNPKYNDTKYVEELIGPATVNTLPVETLDAYRDHGKPELRLERDIEGARLALATLAELNIDIDAITLQLEDEGVEKFNEPYDKLLKILARRFPQPLTAKTQTLASPIRSSADTAGKP
jgi:transaldolase